MMDVYDFVSMLFPFNWVLWFKHNFGPTVLSKARKKGMGILALKALAKRALKKGEENKWKKCWYVPSDNYEEASLGLRFTLFLSDKHPSFRCFARQKGLLYKSLNLSKGIRVIKGIYHIQNVNSYHGRLKIWMNRFKGVATKYLSNYLHWFEFIDSIGKDKIQKVAEMDLLLRACSVKAV